MHLIPLAYVSPADAKAQYRRRNSAYQGEGEDGPSDDLEDFISTQDAIKLLRDPSVDTRVSKPIENAVLERISGYGPFGRFIHNIHSRMTRYPDRVRSHVHHTSVVVPVDVAKALSVRPALVQRAVEAFYTRDALQLRVRCSTLIKCNSLMTQRPHTECQDFLLSRQ